MNKKVTRSVLKAFKKAKFPNANRSAQIFLSVYVRVEKCIELEARLNLQKPVKIAKRRHSIMPVLMSPVQPLSKKRRMSMFTHVRPNIAGLDNLTGSVGASGKISHVQNSSKYNHTTPHFNTQTHEESKLLNDINDNVDLTANLNSTEGDGIETSHFHVQNRSKYDSTTSTPPVSNTQTHQESNSLNAISDNVNSTANLNSTEGDGNETSGFHVNPQNLSKYGSTTSTPSVSNTQTHKVSNSLNEISDNVDLTANLNSTEDFECNEVIVDVKEVDEVDVVAEAISNTPEHLGNSSRNISSYCLNSNHELSKCDDPVAEAMDKLRKILHRRHSLPTHTPCLTSQSSILNHRPIILRPSTLDAYSTEIENNSTQQLSALNINDQPSDQIYNKENEKPPQVTSKPWYEGVVVKPVAFRATSRRSSHK